MQIKPNPLTVIVDPPGVQSGMPGDTLQLHALVSNQGNQGAVIDVFFDEVSQTLQQWCSSPRERLALDPQQSSEVTFEFQIPFDALPGTYDYTLVIDAPEHYPEDTPIQYSRSFKVMLKEQTVVRVNDPTFSLKPTTNSYNPAIIKAGEPLQIVVIVENRSNRVDRFRLTCLDLEDDWFTIRYPTTGLEGAGLLSAPQTLELNPTSKGQISLQFHPPADTIAGSYSPTFRLYSDNSPDLVLLDLVYIQIPTSYRLDVELNTILGKVSRSFGQYEVKLANPGNTLRELTVSAKSRDEEELCTYQCEPSQVRLLPSRNVKVNLTVKPIRWWRRPLIGAGLDLNFKLELQDKQGLPLPEKLPQGTLVWKPRPWWQFLLLVLAALGLLGGVAFIVWLLFFKPQPPLELVNFKSDSSSYTEGDRVRLSWEIRNLNQLSKLALSTKGPVSSPPITYDFSSGIPDELVGKNIANGQQPPCQKQQEVLTCTNISTDARKPGKYTFELKAFPHRGSTVATQMFDVEIAAKPAPEVVSFQSDKPQYTKGELVRLSWQIRNADQLSLQIVGKEDGTIVTEPVTYDFSQGIPPQFSQNKGDKLQPLCQEINQVLTCTNIPVDAPKAGRYTFELQAVSKSAEQSTAKPAETKVEILPKPFKLDYFTLNGSEEANRVLKDGEPVILRWKVEGEDINVELSPYGNVEPSGSRKFIANQALQSPIAIIVTDKTGLRQTTKTTKGFSIKVELPPSPSPSFQFPSLAPRPLSRSAPSAPPPLPRAPKDRSI